MRAGGVATRLAFIRYLGRGNGRFDNLVWMSGNVFQGWKHPKTKMIESDYEFEREATPATWRRLEYWSNLSGASGQFYIQRFFQSRPWQNLVPDQEHTLVGGLTLSMDRWPPNPLSPGL